MANRRRGEVAAEIGGRRLTLCLTLGALAELETTFGVEGLQALGDRFASGQLASRDLVRLLGAGVRGGGTALTDDEIAALPLEGGLPAAIAAVAEMLGLAFGTGAEAPSARP
jgi:hypothetical protein